MASLALTNSIRPVLGDLIPGARTRDAALITGGAALTGLAAQVSVHTSFSPVPFTLQTLSVLTVGAVLGTVRGALSMLLYMAAGMAGVPWFAGHSSDWHVVSFGYVIGFILAAALTGWLARLGADRHLITTVLLMLAGSVVCYGVGSTWLAVDAHLSARQAFDLGVRPFLATDAIKIVVASCALPAAWKLVRNENR